VGGKKAPLAPLDQSAKRRVVIALERRKRWPEVPEVMLLAPRGNGALMRGFKGEYSSTIAGDFGSGFMLVEALDLKKAVAVFAAGIEVIKAAIRLFQLALGAERLARCECNPQQNKAAEQINLEGFRRIEVVEAKHRDPKDIDRVASVVAAEREEIPAEFLSDVGEYAAGVVEVAANKEV
jgi:hypothetical protein